MAIKKWHYGKIILLWAAVAGIFVLGWDSEGNITNLIPVIIAAIAFGITWVWVSGKDT